MMELSSQGWRWVKKTLAFPKMDFKKTFLYDFTTKFVVPFFGIQDFEILKLYMSVEPKIGGKPPKMDGENNGKPY